MKTLNNSIIAAVLTIGSFSITYSQETEIKGDKTGASTQTENRGVDKKDIKRTSSANQSPLYEEKNKEGVNPLYEAQGKGIQENGLKKNAIDVFEEDETPTQTEGKTKGKVTKAGNNGMISVSDENQETPTARKGWDGTVKSGTAAQRKAIKEGGLKKNDADISTSNSEKKGLNAVNVKSSKEASTEISNTIDDTNPTPQGHAVKTKGTGGNTGSDVKPIKVEETKIGQPHP